MNLSGILVVVSPAHFEDVVTALNGLAGVDVHHRDATTGRIIVVQEAESVDQEVDGLQRIQALPHVALAELVYHYFEDDETLAPVTGAVDKRDGNAMPAALDD